MAATLAYIKSRELLPPEAQTVLEGEEGEEAELGDPREHLIKRLLEYQKFKTAAALLAERPVVGRNVWTRDVLPDASDIVSLAPLAEVPVWELIDLLAKLHGKRQRKLTHEVTIERLSLADRINQINEALDSAAPLIQTVYTYDKLLTQLATQEPESDFMYQAVLTLLAVLEMARLRLVAVYQAEERGTIYVCRPGVDPHGGGPHGGGPHGGGPPPSSDPSGDPSDDPAGDPPFPTHDAMPPAGFGPASESTETTEATAA
jgi:segregation and condensation protein A